VQFVAEAQVTQGEGQVEQTVPFWNNPEGQEFMQVPL